MEYNKEILQLINEGIELLDNDFPSFVRGIGDELYEPSHTRTFFDFMKKLLDTDNPVAEITNILIDDYGCFTWDRLDSFNKESKILTRDECAQRPIEIIVSEWLDELPAGDLPHNPKMDFNCCTHNSLELGTSIIRGHVDLDDAIRNPKMNDLYVGVMVNDYDDEDLRKDAKKVSQLHAVFSNPDPCEYDSQSLYEPYSFRSYPILYRPISSLDANSACSADARTLLTKEILEKYHLPISHK